MASKWRRRRQKHQKISGSSMKMAINEKWRVAYIMAAAWREKSGENQT